MSYNQKLVDSLEKVRDSTYKWTAETIRGLDYDVTSEYVKKGIVPRIKGTNVNALRNVLESVVEEEAEPDSWLMAS